jgi:hypothetical protein
VNWNGWPDTVACLESLLKSDYARLSVVVVDNGSTDDSVSTIREAPPWKVLVVVGTAQRWNVTSVHLVCAFYLRKRRCLGFRFFLVFGRAARRFLLFEWRRGWATLAGLRGSGKI